MAKLSRREHLPPLIRLCLTPLPLFVAAFVFAQDITEFSVPTAAPTDLYSMARGSDGATWFGEDRRGKIGRVTPDGVITEFSVGVPAYQMTLGPDGNIWFADGGDIGRIQPNGEFSLLPIPTTPDDRFTSTVSVTSGPGGAVWYADQNHRIGRMSPSGSVTLFLLPDTGRVDPFPYAIAAGPDGNLWYTDDPTIGRMTPAGVVTTFHVPAEPFTDIIAGPDGAMWFSTSSGGIGRISMSGDVRIFDVPTLVSLNLTAGPDGNVWFTFPPDKVGRITPDGVATLFAVPTSSSNPWAIASGPDGNIWFTENAANKIGRLDPRGAGSPLCVPDDHTLCLSNSRFAVNASFRQNPEGASVQATAVQLTSDTGYFWFFDSNNVELIAKVLNGCGVNGSYWVFAAGLTNVGVNLTVRDVQSGVLMRTYENAIGTPFAPIQDTTAFACP